MHQDHRWPSVDPIFNPQAFVQHLGSWSKIPAKVMSHSVSQKWRLEIKIHLQPLGMSICAKDWGHEAHNFKARAHCQPVFCVDCLVEKIQKQLLVSWHPWCFYMCFKVRVLVSTCFIGGNLTGWEAPGCLDVDISLLGTKISPFKGAFRRCFPFRKVGYVSSLEGVYIIDCTCRCATPSRRCAQAQDRSCGVCMCICKLFAFVVLVAAVVVGCCLLFVVYDFEYPFSKCTR